MLWASSVLHWFWDVCFSVCLGQGLYSKQRLQRGAKERAGPLPATQRRMHVFWHRLSWCCWRGHARSLNWPACLSDIFFNRKCVLLSKVQFSQSSTIFFIHDQLLQTFFLSGQYLAKHPSIGRVSSIVNYDKTYGICLRGFADLCAVSNSVNYDRALIWWSTGLWSSLPMPAYAAIGLEQPIAAVLILFLSPSPFSTSSSLSQHKKEIKNKLSTNSPCFGPLSVGL